MFPFGITVQGTKEYVLERIAAAKEAKVTGHGHPLTPEAEKIYEVFEGYIGGMPGGSRVSLSVHVMCNVEQPEAAGPRAVGA